MCEVIIKKAEGVVPRHRQVDCSFATLCCTVFGGIFGEGGAGHKRQLLCLHIVIGSCSTFYLCVCVCVCI